VPGGPRGSPAAGDRPGRRATRGATDAGAVLTGPGAR